MERSAAGPPLLFGMRLWASVCLALYIAFWLQLDNEYWAGLTAAITCQPQLGASLRKGWYADGRGRLVRSGRIEARTGLRMMPVFPRSPLTFRTAGFPRYG